jgi:hypothetical protein
MAVEYDKKEDIEKAAVSKEIVLHCTRATCMSHIVTTRGAYKRALNEEGGLMCETCGARVV